MAVQHVGVQNGRALEHCILLSLGCVGRAIVASFLLLSIFNKFPSSLVFDLMYLYCQHVCFFYLCKQKKMWEGYRFSCGVLLHSVDWLNDYFVSAIPLRISIIRKPMWKWKSPKSLRKEENISNYGKTVSRTLFAVSEVLHFGNNNSQWEPADVTVTILIWVRE